MIRITEELKEIRGVELWNVFLMAALLFLVAEMLVAMQWKPQRAGKPVGA